MALNPKDVDLEKRTISITKSYQRLGKNDVITPPKTPKSKRVITIPEFLAADIKDYMDSLYDLQEDDAFLMVHNGIWDKGLSQREALWRDFLTSVICAGIFSVLYGICLGRMGATEKQTIYLSLLFLGGITIVAFIVLRVLSYFNRKRRRISVNGEQRDIPTSKLGCTKIYNAKDIVEAGRIVELLKEHGIAAFSQEAGASVSMHGASGFGMYGMDVLVETDEVKRALQIIEAADDSQGSEKF